MIASSSTFRPHPGRVIRDLFRLLDAVTALYGSTSLQQSSKGSCSLLVSGYNLRADCQWRTLVSPLSSSTFRPHPGRVIRDLFRLLDAVTALYGSTSLQQSSKGSCSLLVSGYNLRADCQWRTLVSPLNSAANAAPASVLALM